MKITVTLNVSDEEPLESTNNLEDRIQEAMQKFKFVINSYKFEVTYDRPTETIYS